MAICALGECRYPKAGTAAHKRSSDCGLLSGNDSHAPLFKKTKDRVRAINEVLLEIDGALYHKAQAETGALRALTNDPTQARCSK